MAPRHLFPVILLLTTLIGSACLRSSQPRRDGEDDGGVSYYKEPESEMGNTKLDTQLQPKKKVLIFSFWNDTPIQVEGIGAYAANELRRGLSMTGRVMFPPELLNTLKTEDFVDGNRVKVAQLIREGRKMNVGVLVLGRIKKILFRQQGDDIGLLRQKKSLAAVEVEIKIFDVQGGREVMNATHSSEVANNAVILFDANDVNSPGFRTDLTHAALREAVLTFTPEVIKAIDKMVWEGRIAKVAGSKIYINAGRDSGLLVGDILKVFQGGDDVYDPGTGAFLGRTEGQIKGTLEVVDFMTNDGASATLHTGGNFKEGDFVQLY